MFFSRETRKSRRIILTARRIRSTFAATLALLIPFTLIAQGERDLAQLTNWAAPLHWQPDAAKNQIAAARPEALSDGVEAAIPANSLAFVGMTPCRVVDTRPGSGFPGAF